MPYYVIIYEKKLTMMMILKARRTCASWEASFDIIGYNLISNRVSDDDNEKRQSYAKAGEH